MIATAVLSRATRMGLVTIALAGTAHAADPTLERGKYLASIMDCGGCHTRGALAGQPDPAFALAGSDIGFHVPGVGYFYPPNLTPDKETGLGEWTEADIIRAVRNGERPDGRRLAPVMPFPAYSVLTDEDAVALARYLQSLPPVAFPSEPGPTSEADPAPGPYLTPKMP